MKDAFTVPQLWVIVPFTTLQMIALSTNLYIIPQLVVSKVCHSKFNHSVCKQLGYSKFKAQEDIVYEEAAAWNALISFAGFFPSSIITLPLGAVTDLVSKRKILLLPAIFNLVSCLINLCSSVFLSLHIGFLVLASFVTCAFAEMPGCITLCCAYAANTCAKNRTLALTLAMVSVELGCGIGCLVGNYLARYYGYSSAFIAAAVGLIVALMYWVAMIPPLDSDTTSKSFAEEQYDSWSGMKEHVKEVYYHLMSFSKKYIWHPTDNTILLLLITIFFNMAGYAGERTLISIFLKHSPLNFHANEIGIYVSLFQFSRATGLVILVFILKKSLNISDYLLMIIGATGMSLSFIVLGLSQNHTMVYLSSILALPGAFAPTATRSMQTKIVPTKDHGISLSFHGLLQVAAMVLMSPVANALFAGTATKFSGFAIIVMGFTHSITIAFSCYLFFSPKHGEKVSENYHEISNTGDHKE